MTTKFESCLDYLSKEASNLTPASGLGRLGQLLTGSRAQALEERAQGVSAAGQRALASWRNPESTHSPVSTSLRYLANEAAAQRAARAAGKERGAVLAARGIGAGALGASALGAHALTQEQPDPSAEPQPKSPFREGAKVLGSSLAGFGLGHIAGALAGRGIEAVTKRQGGDPVEVARKIAPIVGTAAGFIYPMWRAREQQEITNAVESARDENERRVSGQ